MPRGRKPDLFGSLRAQASKLLSQLDAQIHALEGEVAHLREQADSWRSAVGGKLRGAVGGTGKRRGRPSGRPRGAQKGARVSWGEVLASVPKRFGVQDVMKHPGAAAKGRGQVYPAFTRWEVAKRIKRVGKGVYEKTGGGVAAGGARGPAKRK